MELIDAVSDARTDLPILSPCKLFALRASHAGQSSIPKYRRHCIPEHFCHGRDPFVPARRSAALLQAIKRTARKVGVMTLDAGHVETMVLSAQYQYAMAGIERSRRWLRDCLSFLPLRHVAER